MNIGDKVLVTGESVFGATDYDGKIATVSYPSQSDPENAVFVSIPGMQDRIYLKSQLTPITIQAVCLKHGFIPGGIGVTSWSYGAFVVTESTIFHNGYRVCDITDPEHLTRLLRELLIPEVDEIARALIALKWEYSLDRTRLCYKSTFVRKTADGWFYRDSDLKITSAEAIHTLVEGQ